MSILAFNSYAGSTPLLSGPTLRTMLVLGLHAGAIAWALHAPGVTASASLPVPAPMALVAVMPAPPARPVAAAPQPAPSRPQPSTVPTATAKPQPTAGPQPRRIPGAAAVISSSAVPVTVAEAAPSASAAPAQAAAPAPAQTAPVAAARFDADYLNNPAPAYPLLSRRQGESGTVLLLVQVSAQGTAAQVEIRQGCGFPRLDQAALDAVRQWRFVPARRGDTAVAASVVVPVTFRLGA